MMGTIGNQLAGSQEIGAALQQVAQILVPQFADHCLIDLFHGDVLIRRVARHATGWTPPPGTWAQVGEPIRYPEGHFCQQAMARLDTVLVVDLAKAGMPAPSARSEAAAWEVGLTSILTAPLYAPGVLLGVISVARSRLTDRPEPRFTAADRELMGVVANRIATVIDNAKQQPGCQHPDHARLAEPWLRRRPYASLASE